jgi:biotin transporter BioY
VITREHGGYVQKRIHFMGPWVQTGFLVINLLEMLLIGCIVAISAKGREMVATMTLLLAEFAFLCIGAAWMIERHTVIITSTTHSPYLLIFSLPLYFLERTFTVVLGGLIVRMCRNSAAQRTSGQRTSAV